jgi:hypothetical protein
MVDKAVFPERYSIYKALGKITDAARISIIMLIHNRGII